jgi:hypothetical protein
MNNIPDYASALEKFRKFLADNHHPDDVLWIFRDDFWKLSLDRVFIKDPLHRDNEALVKKVYEEGRICGLINLQACAVVGQKTAATIWFPKHPGEEMQGWECGLRLSIVQPLPLAKKISPFQWNFLKLLPGFRRSQRFLTMIRLIAGICSSMGLGL